MTTSGLIAAYVLFLSISAAPSNSVQHYDRLINVTPRVIERTIIADVQRIHASNLTDQQEKRNIKQLENHCLVGLKAAKLGQYEIFCDIIDEQDNYLPRYEGVVD